MQDSVLYDLEFTKFADELDVSQHFALGHKLGFKLFLSRLVSIFKGYVGLGSAQTTKDSVRQDFNKLFQQLLSAHLPVFELFLALVE